MPRVKSPLKILELDIETMYTVVKTWTLWPKYISPNDVIEPGEVICWAARWHGERDMHFSSAHRDGRERMMQQMAELLDEADAVMHYNGKAFDTKHLNREFLLQGIDPPSHFHQIDLLSVVKKQFKFESNKLDYVCRRLGLGSKTTHQGMGLWDKCKAGDAAAWKLMEKYNKQDVRLLTKLYKRLRPWITGHPNCGLYLEDATRPTCPNCGSTDVHEKGTQYNSKAASYKRYKCLGCGAPLRSRLQSKTTSENVLTRTP